MVEIVRELELEVEPEDVIEMLQAHGKLKRIRSYFLQISKESLRWKLLLVKML